MYKYIFVLNSHRFFTHRIITDNGIISEREREKKLRARTHTQTGELTIINRRENVGYSREPRVDVSGTEVKSNLLSDT